MFRRMRKGLHGGWLFIALAWAAPSGAQAPGPDAVPLALEDAIEQALAHNRDLVKGALELQGDRLAEQQSREAARGIQIVPEGSAGVGPAGGE